MASSGKSVKSRHHLGASDVLFSLAIVIGFFTLWPLMVIAAFVMFFVWAVKMLKANTIFLLSFILCGVIVSLGTTMTQRNLIWGLSTLTLFVMYAKKIEVSKPIGIAFLLYWLFVTFSILSAPNYGEALNQSLRVFPMMAYMCVASIALKNKKGFPEILIIFTIAFSVYAFIVFLGIGTSLMRNKNLTSAVILLLMILCLHYYKYWKRPAIIAVVLSMIIILILRHRASLLAIAIGGMVYAFSYRKHFIKTFCVLIIIGCLAFCVKGKSLFDSESMSQRKEAWRHTVSMIIDNPHGVGAGNWKLVYPSYMRYSPVTRAMNYRWESFAEAHNDYLQNCSEIGILGFTCYLSIFVLAVYYSRGWIRVGIVVFMTIAFFSFPMMIPFPSLLLMIYLAHIKTKTINLHKSFVICASIILCVCAVNFAFRHSMAKKVMRIYTARANNDWDTVLLETDKISSLYNIDHSSNPLLFYRGLAYHFKGDDINAMYSFEKALLVNPNHLFVMMNLASKYATDGQYNKAKMVYSRVSKLYPEFGQAEKEIRNINAMLEKIHNVKREIEMLRRGT